MLLWLPLVVIMFAGIVLIFCWLHGWLGRSLGLLLLVFMLFSPALPARE